MELTARHLLTLALVALSPIGCADESASVEIPDVPDEIEKDAGSRPDDDDVPDVLVPFDDDVTDDVDDASDDASDDAPSPEDVALDAPRADVAMDTPRTDALTDAPRVDVSMDAPRMDAVADVTRADAAADVQRADVPADRPTDAGGFNFPTPIRHVIVIVKENHTLDSMFTGLPGANTTTTARRSSGPAWTRTRLPSGVLPSDVGHSHHSAVVAYANGAMNGFDTNSEATSTNHSPTLALRYYAESQIPNYWQYARRFVLCDRFFSAVLANSTPGHFALWTAQTPMISNPDCPGADCDSGPGCYAERGTTIATLNQTTCAISTGSARPCFDVPSVIDHLPPSLSWRAYAHADAAGDVYSPISLVRSATRSRAYFDAHVANQTALVADLRAGRQANITYVHVGGGASEHPPADICPGENFTVNVINAAMEGPNWRDTAILFTYDDWGGFYDHVAPPQSACRNGDHVSLGFRLPLIIISPYTRRSTDPAHPFVFHGTSEQASVPKLIEDLFRLPRMSVTDRHARDTVAGSLMGAFDFTHPDFTPVILRTRTCP